MRRGRNRCFVTIQQSTPSQSSSGEAIDSWSTYAQAWMDLRGTTGRESRQAHQVMAEADHIGRFDWIDAQAVTPRMQVVYGTRTFDILHVANLGERNREVELQLRERNP